MDAPWRNHQQVASVHRDDVFPGKNLKFPCDGEQNLRHRPVGVWRRSLRSQRSIPLPAKALVDNGELGGTDSSPP